MFLPTDQRLKSFIFTNTTWKEIFINEASVYYHLKADPECLLGWSNLPELCFAQVFPTSEAWDSSQLGTVIFSKLDQNLCFSNLKEFPFLYESFVQLVSFHPSFHFIQPNQLYLHLNPLFCNDQEILGNFIRALFCCIMILINTR